MSAIPSLLFLLATGLSLSVGWGIRGNFGHEAGAMIPGALATLAAVLISDRADWWSRASYFAFFGALGWAIGGCMSYMQVIAYTHSGHSGTIAYGFGSLFVIGFLWGALGGAGSGLPACLDRPRLVAFFPLLGAIFAVWTAQFYVEKAFESDPDFRHRSALYWYDTNWLHVLTAAAAALGVAAIRRRFDFAVSLVLHAAAGWWIAFLTLVVGLGWRMTPPRGDNWAGCLGMVAALVYFFQRRGLGELTRCALISGFVGGFGFAFADLLKLLGIGTGWDTNWHSLLEQSYGFINGIALALAIWSLARRQPAVADAAPTGGWTGPAACLFTLAWITYINLVQNVSTWVRAKTVPAIFYGLSAGAWFDLAYAILTGVILLVLAANRRRPVALLAVNDLGRAQLLYLVLLWWIVIGNFERSVVAFAPQRIVTEGVIFLNAAICTALVLLRPAPRTGRAPAGIASAAIGKVALLGAFLALGSTVVEWAVVRGVYGDRPIPYAGKHIRFGPDATATTAKPAGNQPHP